jgi:methyl-accepting chemotaxis protein
VRDVLARLSEASGTMRRTAGAMEGGVTRARDLTLSTASGASDSSRTLGEVAGATEHLAASRAEINRQVREGAETAAAVAEQAAATDRAVRGLSEATSRIGEVVGLISEIAGQTNLLALNATIEAARAGEAGKGFAVVAGEVKNLAGQTAKATEEIGAQISAMQGATMGAVDAIRAIGGRIGEISELAASVASAVEQQGAATSEIAHSVQQAAANTGHVNTAIGRVGESAASAASGGDAIRRDASTLSGQAEALRAAVRGLVAELRAA